MALSLPDKWLWDFWFAQEAEKTHVFYLQAPRIPDQPELRHWQVSIGHAVSEDLTHWDILPDVITPEGEPAEGEQEAWDSKTTWTGSVIKHEGRWYLFYTGTTHSEKGLVQRVGLAISDDIINWIKHPKNPVIVADPTYYELLDLNLWHDQAWRDPWVFKHPETGEFHAFITARTNQGPADERGVIGHATSDDLINWQVKPPLAHPGGFGHMEVPQLVHIGDLYYLIFSCPQVMYSNNHKARAKTTIGGTHYLVGETPLGPFHTISEEPIIGPIERPLYSGKLIQGNDGTWYFMGFHSYTPDGQFIGTLSDPYPITIAKDGTLSLA